MSKGKNQLAIHKDEGRDSTNINYHGHLVFFTLDVQTGKSLQRQNFNNKEKMRQAQTITANVLNMTRGTSKEITNAEHLNHRQYKASLAIAEKHKTDEMQKWHNRLKEQFINILETTAQAVKKFFMSEQINQMEAENIQLKQQVVEHKNQINQQHNKIKFITEEQYGQAQRIRKGKSCITSGSNALQNPLSGLIYCQKCGSLMHRAYIIIIKIIHISFFRI